MTLALLCGCDWEDEPPAQETLTVVNTADNVAHAVSTPSGINCGPGANETACSVEFDRDTYVHLSTTIVGTRCSTIMCTVDGQPSSSCNLSVSLSGDTVVRITCP